MGPTGNKKYLRTRVIEYLLTFLIILTINFFLPRMMPGDPFLHLSGEGGEEVWTFTEKQREHFIEYYGLDRPLGEQYFSYLLGVVQGDLGFSYYFRDEVSEMILRRLPWTVFMVTGGLAFSLLVGISLGTFSAWHRESYKDRFIYLLMVVFSEIPAFLVGIFLLVLLASGLGWFPLSGAMTHYADLSGWDKFIDLLHHAALPIITLGLARAGGTYMLVRNTTTTVLKKEYTRTARAKGLTERRIRYRHVLKNALLPLVTRIALQLGALVGGAVLVENVFAYPGLGLLMQEAVFVRDYPLLQGIFLVIAFGVLAANLLADMLYRYLDPRIQDGYNNG